MTDKIKEFRKEAQKLNKFVQKNASAEVAGHVQGYNSSLEEWLEEWLRDLIESCPIPNREAVNEQDKGLIDNLNAWKDAYTKKYEMR